MAKLDAQDRKALPKGSFAVPSKAPGSGSYPIPDAGHARNALARAAQNGSPAVKAEVRAKVHEKFPGIGKGGSATANHGSGAQAKAQPPTKPRAPEPDTRSQSRPFVAPPGQRGSPAAPHSVAKGFARHPNDPATSGLDRAMSEHADREHPTRRS